MAHVNCIIASFKPQTPVALLDPQTPLATLIALNPNASLDPQSLTAKFDPLNPNAALFCPPATTGPIAYTSGFSGGFR